MKSSPGGEARSRSNILCYAKNITGASNGFDRDHEAGEASRRGCVKFHN